MWQQCSLRIVAIRRYLWTTFNCLNDRPHTDKAGSRDNFPSLCSGGSKFNFRPTNRSSWGFAWFSSLLFQNTNYDLSAPSRTLVSSRRLFHIFLFTVRWLLDHWTLYIIWRSRAVLKKSWITKWTTKQLILICIAVYFGHHSVKYVWLT